VKGVIGIEADIPAELLEGVPFVAAMDWLPTSFTEKADIILPTTSWVEMDGTYVNVEGRGQRFRRVMQPGVPIRGLDPARHPPRVHRALPPGSSIRPAWQAIAALLERLGDEPLSEPLRGKWERLRSLDPEGEGMIIATHREPLS
jgi:NADH-quinone oxidoreductase subunit G